MLEETTMAKQTTAKATTMLPTKPVTITPESTPQPVEATTVSVSTIAKADVTEAVTEKTTPLLEVLTETTKEPQSTDTFSVTDEIINLIDTTTEAGITDTVTDELSGDFSTVRPDLYSTTTVGSPTVEGSTMVTDEQPSTPGIQVTSAQFVDQTTSVKPSATAQEIVSKFVDGEKNKDGLTSTVPSTKTTTTISVTDEPRTSFEPVESATRSVSTTPQAGVSRTTKSSILEETTMAKQTTAKATTMLPTKLVSTIPESTTQPVEATTVSVSTTAKADVTEAVTEKTTPLLEIMTETTEKLSPTDILSTTDEILNLIYTTEAGSTDTVTDDLSGDFSTVTPDQYSTATVGLSTVEGSTIVTDEQASTPGIQLTSAHFVDQTTSVKPSATAQEIVSKFVDGEKNKVGLTSTVPSTKRTTTVSVTDEPRTSLEPVDPTTLSVSTTPQAGVSGTTKSSMLEETTMAKQTTAKATTMLPTKPVSTTPESTPQPVEATTVSVSTTAKADTTEAVTEKTTPLLEVLTETTKEPQSTDTFSVTDEILNLIDATPEAGFTDTVTDDLSGDFSTVRPDLYSTTTVGPPTVEGSTMVTDEQPSTPGIQVTSAQFVDQTTSVKPSPTAQEIVSKFVDGEKNKDGLTSTVYSTKTTTTISVTDEPRTSFEPVESAPHSVSTTPQAGVSGTTKSSMLEKTTMAKQTTAKATTMLPTKPVSTTPESTPQPVEATAVSISTTAKADVTEAVTEKTTPLLEVLTETTKELRSTDTFSVTDEITNLIDTTTEAGITDTVTDELPGDFSTVRPDFYSTTTVGSPTVEGSTMVTDEQPSTPGIQVTSAQFVDQTTSVKPFATAQEIVSKFVDGEKNKDGLTSTVPSTKTTTTISVTDEPRTSFEPVESATRSVSTTPQAGVSRTTKSSMLEETTMAKQTTAKATTMLPTKPVSTTPESTTQPVEATTMSVSTTAKADVTEAVTDKTTPLLEIMTETTEKFSPTDILSTTDEILNLICTTEAGSTDTVTDDISGDFSTVTPDQYSTATVGLSTVEGSTIVTDEQTSTPGIQLTSAYFVDQTTFVKPSATAQAIVSKFVDGEKNKDGLTSTVPSTKSTTTVSVTDEPRTGLEPVDPTTLSVSTTPQAGVSGTTKSSMLKERTMAKQTTAKATTMLPTKPVTITPESTPQPVEATTVSVSTTAKADVTDAVTEKTTPLLEVLTETTKEPQSTDTFSVTNEIINLIDTTTEAGITDTVTDELPGDFSTVRPDLYSTTTVGPPTVEGSTMVTDEEPSTPGIKVTSAQFVDQTTSVKPSATAKEIVSKFVDGEKNKDGLTSTVPSTKTTTTISVTDEPRTSFEPVESTTRSVSTTPQAGVSGTTKSSMLEETTMAKQTTAKATSMLPTKPVSTTPESTPQPVEATTVSVSTTAKADVTEAVTEKTTTLPEVLTKTTKKPQSTDTFSVTDEKVNLIDTTPEAGITVTVTDELSGDFSTVRPDLYSTTTVGLSTVEGSTIVTDEQPSTPGIQVTLGQFVDQTTSVKPSATAQEIVSKFVTTTISVTDEPRTSSTVKAAITLATESTPQPTEATTVSASTTAQTDVTKVVTEQTSPLLEVLTETTKQQESMISFLTTDEIMDLMETTAVAGSTDIVTDGFSADFSTVRPDRHSTTLVDTSTVPTTEESTILPDKSPSTEKIIITPIDLKDQTKNVMPSTSGQQVVTTKVEVTATDGKTTLAQSTLFTEDSGAAVTENSGLSAPPEVITLMPQATSSALESTTSPTRLSPTVDWVSTTEKIMSAQPFESTPAGKDMTQESKVLTSKQTVGPPGYVSVVIPIAPTADKVDMIQTTLTSGVTDATVKKDTPEASTESSGLSLSTFSSSLEPVVTDELISQTTASTIEIGFSAPVGRVTKQEVHSTALPITVTTDRPDTPTGPVKTTQSAEESSQSTTVGPPAFVSVSIPGLASTASTSGDITAAVRSLTEITPLSSDKIEQVIHDLTTVQADDETTRQVSTDTVEILTAEQITPATGVSQLNLQQTLMSTATEKTILPSTSQSSVVTLSTTMTSPQQNNTQAVIMKTPSAMSTGSGIVTTTTIVLTEDGSGTSSPTEVSFIDDKPTPSSKPIKLISQTTSSFKETPEMSTQGTTMSSDVVELTKKDSTDKVVIRPNAVTIAPDVTSTSVKSTPYVSSEVKQAIVDTTPAVSVTSFASSGSTKIPNVTNNKWTARTVSKEPTTMSVTTESSGLSETTVINTKETDKVSAKTSITQVSTDKNHGMSSEATQRVTIYSSSSPQDLDQTSEYPSLSSTKIVMTDAPVESTTVFTTEGLVQIISEEISTPTGPPAIPTLVLSTEEVTNVQESVAPDNTTPPDGVRRTSTDAATDLRTTKQSEEGDSKSTTIQPTQATSKLSAPTSPQQAPTLPTGPSVEVTGHMHTTTVRMPGINTTDQPDKASPGIKPIEISPPGIFTESRLHMTDKPTLGHVTQQSTTAVPQKTMNDSVTDAQTTEGSTVNDELITELMEPTFETSQSVEQNIVTFSTTKTPQEVMSTVKQQTSDSLAVQPTVLSTTEGEQSTADVKVASTVISVTSKPKVSEVPVKDDTTTTISSVTPEVASLKTLATQRMSVSEAKTTLLMSTQNTEGATDMPVEISTQIMDMFTTEDAMMQTSQEPVEENKTTSLTMEQSVTPVSWVVTTEEDFSGTSEPPRLVERTTSKKQTVDFTMTDVTTVGKVTHHTKLPSTTLTSETTPISTSVSQTQRQPSDSSSSSLDSAPTTRPSASVQSFVSEAGMPGSGEGTTEGPQKVTKKSQETTVPVTEKPKDRPTIVPPPPPTSPPMRPTSIKMRHEHSSPSTHKTDYPRVHTTLKTVDQTREIEVTTTEEPSAVSATSKTATRKTVPQSTVKGTVEVTGQTTAFQTESTISLSRSEQATESHLGADHTDAHLLTSETTSVTNEEMKTMPTVQHTTGTKLSEVTLMSTSEQDQPTVVPSLHQTKLTEEKSTPHAEVTEMQIKITTPTIARQTTSTFKPTKQTTPEPTTILPVEILTEQTNTVEDIATSAAMDPTIAPVATTVEELSGSYQTSQLPLKVELTTKEGETTDILVTTDLSTIEAVTKHPVPESTKVPRMSTEVKFESDTTIPELTTSATKDKPTIIPPPPPTSPPVKPTLTTLPVSSTDTRMPASEVTQVGELKTTGVPMRSTMRSDKKIEDVTSKTELTSGLQKVKPTIMASPAPTILPVRSTLLTSPISLPSAESSTAEVEVHTVKVTSEPETFDTGTTVAMTSAQIPTEIISENRKTSPDLMTSSDTSETRHPEYPSTTMELLRRTTKPAVTDKISVETLSTVAQSSEEKTTAAALQSLLMTSAKSTVTTTAKPTTVLSLLKTISKSPSTAQMKTDVRSSTEHITKKAVNGSVVTVMPTDGLSTKSATTGKMLTTEENIKFSTTVSPPSLLTVLLRTINRTTEVWFQHPKFSTETFPQEGSGETPMVSQDIFLTTDSGLPGDAVSSASTPDGATPDGGDTETTTESYWITELVKSTFRAVTASVTGLGSTLVTSDSDRMSTKTSETNKTEEETTSKDPFLFILPIKEGSGSEEPPSRTPPSEGHTFMIPAPHGEASGEVTGASEGQQLTFTSLSPTTPEGTFRVFELVNPFGGVTQKTRPSDTVSPAVTADAVTTKVEPSSKQDPRTCAPCLPDVCPVCGSDGFTYSSACELKRVACLRGSTSLESVYEGDCIPGLLELVNGTKTCAEFECPNFYNPVCGSDHVTYDNDCSLIKRQLCTEGAQDLTKQHHGICEDFLDATFHL
ncbi:mucin-17-like [Asterias rubens]|uniref:mucin-17-like n=1 Tax=Asterias rubens TaxID=7604 RepID=UPI0014554FBC|nr:mucin-17-like [Asterias rubens]